MKTLVIPMAGLGSRFTKAGFTTHKPLIELDGIKLIRRSIDSLNLVLSSWKVVLIARDLGEGYKEEVEAEVPEAEFIWINEMTSGATETALFASALIDPEEELIVTNCDQYLDWDVADFLSRSREEEDIVGSVLTYKSTNPKNSFCRSDSSGKILEIVEKDPISDQALVGLHWWRYGKDFIATAERLVNDCPEDRETYISETYSYLIGKGGIVKAIPIKGKYWSLGTPEDFYIFKGYLAEFHMPKPRTFFIDLDGTVLLHGHRYSNLNKEGQEACPGVIAALDEIDSLGHKIILVSARKESSRRFTEKNLARLGIPYDQLILGVSQGKRVVVNDMISSLSEPRSSCVDVITDKGWTSEELLKC
jgi:NDP-sugar pyrophosphorylase family protein